MFGAARIATYHMGGGGAGSGGAPAYSWNISTATTNYKGTARIGDQDNTPTEVVFNNDGTKMYVLGDTNNRVYEYTLSTAYNIFTAVYSTFVSITTQDSSPQGLAFSSDGTKMYFLGNINDRVYQFTLSTAWSLATATDSGKVAYVGGQETNPTGVDFSTDGTKMYIVGSVNDTVYQYDVSPAWDVSTASYASKSVSVTTQSNSPQSVRFLDSGTKMYILNQTSSVYQYTLSTAWDVSTASYASKVFNFSTVGGYETNTTGMCFKSDGTQMLIVGTTYDYVWSLPLSTANDISTASFATTDNYRLGTNDSTPVGIKFKPDGTKFYFLGSGNDRVWEYSCSTAWDINTTTFTSGRFIAIGTQEANGQDLAFSSDGTKMYVIGTTVDTIYQYTLSTAWLITSATYATKSFSVTTQESFPTGIAFNDDGTKFYVVGEGSSTVYQYSCSTAWDISTASYASLSFSVSSQVTTPAALAFKPDGTKMYVLGQGNDLIAQYSLSTAWNISTASYDSQTLSVLNVDHQAFGMDIAADGSRIYAVGQNIDRLIQWTLT